jgi:hypothetical protein
MLQILQPRNSFKCFDGFIEIAQLIPDIVSFKLSQSPSRLIRSDPRLVDIPEQSAGKWFHYYNTIY